MKVKHIFAVVICFISFLVMFNLVIHPKLEAMFISTNVSKGNLDEAKMKILKNIDQDRSNRFELIKMYMIEPQPYSRQYDVYISPSMSTVSSMREDRLFTIEESLPYLKLYIEEASPDGFLVRATQLVKDYYETTGDYEKLDHLLEKAGERFIQKNYHYHEIQIMRIEAAINNNETNRAINLMEEFKGELDETFIDFSIRLSKLKAENLLQQGKYEEAYQLLSEAIDEHEQREKQWAEKMKDVEGFEVGESFYLQALVQQQQQIKSLLNSNDTALGVVDGRIVRSTGEPVSNASVFLRPKEDVQRSIIETDRQMITDHDGYFSFTGVLPGSYQITVGFLFEQIDGWAWPVEMDDWIDVGPGMNVQYPITLTPLIETKSPSNYEVIKEQTVTFQWEPVPNAGSYELTGNIILENGSIGFHMISGITEAEVTVPVEKLYSVRSGVVFEDDTSSVDPKSILGFANADGTFSWSVKAFDENGKAIGQSNGYRLREETMGSIPFFHLKARELTKADRQFLKDGNVKNALSLYRQTFSEDPTDAHSLRMITRLMGMSREGDLEALPYYLKLAELSPDPELLFTIANMYFYQQDWDQFDDWFDRYKELVRGGPNSYTNSIYATSLLKRGQFQEGRDHFYEVLQTDNSNRFVGFFLAAELYLQEDWARIENLAATYKERGMHATNWESLVNQLRQHGNLINVKKAIELHFTSTEEKTDDFLKEVNEPLLSTFIEKLKNVR